MTAPNCPFPALVDVWPRIAGYRILRALGIGGMGAVFAAEAPDGGPVAIKIIDTGISATLQARFQNEARAAAAVVHPRLVRCYDLGQVAGHPYLIMELILGGDVEALRIRSGGTLDRDRIIAIGLDAAEGLIPLHAQGIIHRDIKPSNLLIGDDDRCKLGDFGLVRFADGHGGDVTRAGVAIGTPDYMAPEQARGELVDHRADLYALGASLYHLAVGEPPHAGNTTWMTIAGLLSEPFPDPFERRPEIGADLCMVIARLGAKVASERYQSAEDLRSDLMSLRQGDQPTLARRQREDSPSRSTACNGPAVLLVDDDPIARRIYAAGLRKCGLATIEAEDAASGIAAAARDRPVAAVVDLMLPDMDGSEVVRRLRADHPSLPVIVLSNAFAVEHLARARSAGADAVLSKERVSPGALADAVGRMVPHRTPHDDLPVMAMPMADMDATARTALARIQVLLRRLGPDGDEGPILDEITRTARGLSSAAAAAGAQQAATLAAAAEALARELTAQPGRRSASTRHTLGQAAEALRRLLGVAPRTPRNIRALAVDDDRMARTLLSRAMTRVGIPHTLVGSPEEALKALASGMYDLLVTDVVMDGMSGFQLAGRVRGLVGCERIPVLFATGIEDFPTFFAADRDKGVDLIAKPYLLIELGVKALVLLAERDLGS